MQLVIAFLKVTIMNSSGLCSAFLAEEPSMLGDQNRSIPYLISRISNVNC